MCNWMSMPYSVENDGALYKVMVGCAVADIFMAVGILLIFWSARVFLWADFKATISDYRQIEKHRIVLDKYKNLMSETYKAEAYFEKLSKKSKL